MCQKLFALHLLSDELAQLVHIVKQNVIIRHDSMLVINVHSVGGLFINTRNTRAHNRLLVENLRARLTANAAIWQGNSGGRGAAEAEVAKQ